MNRGKKKREEKKGRKNGKEKRKAPAVLPNNHVFVHYRVNTVCIG